MAAEGVMNSLEVKTATGGSSKNLHISLRKAKYSKLDVVLKGYYSK